MILYLKTTFVKLKVQDIQNGTDDFSLSSMKVTNLIKEIRERLSISVFPIFHAENYFIRNEEGF